MNRRAVLTPVLIAVLATAGRADPVPVALAAWTPSQVTFRIAAESEFLLTVTGPAFVFQARGRGNITFWAQDEDGLPLLDGPYRYELREIVTSPKIEAWEAEPDPERRRAIQRALLRAGRWPRPRIQHDLFRIEAGAVVAPRPRARIDVDESAREDDAGHDHPHAHEGEAS